MNSLVLIGIPIICYIDPADESRDLTHSVPAVYCQQMYSSFLPEP